MSWWLLCLCFASLLEQKFGQDAAAENTRWRIINAEPTVGYWAVAEVEFHTAGSCNEYVEGGALSSGWVAMSPSGAHTPNLAFDRQSRPDIVEAWWSPCGYVLGDVNAFAGGCAIGEAWIGLDAAFGYVDVKCVRLLQVENANHSVSTIGLDRWDGSRWVRVQTFIDTGGVEAQGRFLDLTVDPNSKWRLRPVLGEAGDQPWPTSMDWGVAELELYSTIECSGPPLSTRFGAAGLIGNGTAPSDLANPPSLAQDGSFSTAWVSPCSLADACNAEGVWLDAQLHTASMVRCIRLVQAADSWTSSILVQSWTGTMYINASLFLDLRPGAWDHLTRWEAADNVAGTLWRLVPTGDLPTNWHVAELEVFTDTNCSEQAERAAAMGSSSLYELPVGAIADGNVSSYWQAASPIPGASALSWEGLYEGTGTTHHLGRPWLGLSTTTSVTLLCVKLLQDNITDNCSANMLLQRWNGSGWFDYVEHHNGKGEVQPHFKDLIGLGTPKNPPFWLRMPLLDRTMWRVQATDVMFNHWAVKELSFYETIDCQLEVKGLAIAAGQEPHQPRYPAANAFDRGQLTEWWSVCDECLEGAAWLGVALDRPRNMRCFRMFQSSKAPNGNVLTPWSSLGVSLDKWNGNKWVSLFSFYSLSVGAWDQNYVYWHRPMLEDSVSGLRYWESEPDRLWRVTHLGELPRRWAVGSAGFYWDLDCTVRIDDAFVIESGWVLGFDVERAFVQNDSENVEWVSSCDGCGSQVAWLGLHMPVRRWPRCVRIYQTSRKDFGSTSLSVERYQGAYWDPVVQKQDAAPNSWETLLLPGPRLVYDTDGGLSDHPGGIVFNDRERWRVVGMASMIFGWKVGGLRFFSTLHCQDEVFGLATSSGYVTGHEPSLAVSSKDDSTYWQASCEMCRSGQAWVGLSFSRDDPLPKCIQLWQVPDDSWYASQVSVEVHLEDDSGGTWFQVASFSDLNLGVWDHLHLWGSLPAGFYAASGRSNSTAAAVPEGQLWRVVNGEDIQRSWAISYLRFLLFDDMTVDGCSETALEGTAFASGSQSSETPPQMAVDPSLQNAGGHWESPCTDCNTGGAWLGIILPSPQEVACVDFKQSDDDLHSTQTVLLQRWDGSSWETYRTFEGVTSGVLVRLNAAWERPAPHQRMRLQSLSTPVHGWHVTELAFYAGIECELEVRGIAISSGSEAIYSPRLAFDNKLSTYWQEKVKPTIGGVVSDSGAWIGMHFLAPADVKCTVLRQDDTPGRWAPAVAFQTWTGTTWEVSAMLSNAYTGGWFALHWFHSAWPALYVNFQDDETPVPEGYLADKGQRFPGDLSSGHRYGWSCRDVAGANRDYYGDPVLDTSVALSCDPSARWELDVILGRYYVQVLYSDPGNQGETSGCYLEGVSANVGLVSPYETANKRLIVSVLDARLTFNGSSTSGCSAVSSIEILSLPGSSQMWRLKARSAVTDRWTVYELGLHEEPSCADADVMQQSGRQMFASGYKDGELPELAADGDIQTSWTDACFGCEGGSSWIASSFVTVPRIRCVKLYQAAEKHSMSPTIELESWNQTAWVLQEIFDDTQGGVWGKFNSRWATPLYGYRWRLALAQNLSTKLLVTDLQFFSDLACSQVLPGLAIASDAQEGFVALNAFDDDAEGLTSWASACGPCAPGEAWIGLHYDDAVNVSCTAITLGVPPGMDERQLQGLGAVGGITATGGTAAKGDPVHLELEIWNSTAWVLANTPVYVRAGARAATSRLAAQDVPASAAWRIVNADVTSMPWRVQEVQFFTQTTCEGQVFGNPLASSFMSRNPPTQAFDDVSDSTSAWVAGCESWGCPVGEWLGILLDGPTSFQCVRIYQSSGSLLGNPAAGMLRAERWAGRDVGWVTSRTFGTVDPLDGGTWSDLIILSAEAKFATKATEWRLVAETSVKKHWSVAELAMFDNVECELPLTGTAAASGDAANRFVTAAFDGVMETFWWSQESPGPQEAWLGLFFGAPQLVQCIQVVLSGAPDYSTASVQLQSRPEADWLHIRSFDRLVPSERVNLPVFEAAQERVENSMWRILNQDEFYSDKECKTIEIGRSISSGYARGMEPSAGSDTSVDTWWGSPCFGCNRREAYLGITFQSFSSSTRVLSRGANIQCIVLLQGSGLQNTSANISVQRWDGKKFETVRLFDNVPGGDFVKLRLDLPRSNNDSMVIDLQRKELLVLAAQEEEEDPELKRDSLEQSRDKILANIEMFVDLWPPELTSSVAVASDFVRAWSRALGKALGTQLQQPSGNIFVDDGTLQSSVSGSKPSISGEMTMYIASESDAVLPGRTWEMKGSVVLNKLTDISQDPYNIEALFLLDQLKIELRKSTRLNPVLSSITAQIELSVDIRVGVPSLIVFVAPTTSGIPEIIPEPEPEEEDNNVIFLVVGCVVVLLAFCCGVRCCLVRRERLRLEKEAWMLANPGTPFPTIKTTMRCRRCRYVCCMILCRRCIPQWIRGKEEDYLPVEPAHHQFKKQSSLKPQKSLKASEDASDEGTSYGKKAAPSALVEFSVSAERRSPSGSPSSGSPARSPKGSPGGSPRRRGQFG
eukprot:TRINITY_DN32247_c0_g1_i1.p1 TRINITY_DN32247_c0_g1~~TRINITY_DN32247_c0_g1_i1.p1  ORF type:complete len:2549 (-),score=430.20 TRINITY_DN32247_c0_g1_i1:21-7667(-)